MNKVTNSNDNGELCDKNRKNQFSKSVFEEPNHLKQDSQINDFYNNFSEDKFEKGEEFCRLKKYINEPYKNSFNLTKKLKIINKRIQGDRIIKNNIEEFENDIKINLKNFQTSPNEFLYKDMKRNSSDNSLKFKNNINIEYSDKEPEKTLEKEKNTKSLLFYSNEQEYRLYARKEFLKEIKHKIIISQKKILIFEGSTIDSEANVRFNFSLFFKYIFYHILYFFFLGPILTLILLPIEGIDELKAMGFIGYKFGFFSQLLMFFCGAPNLILMVYFKKYSIKIINNLNTIENESYLKVFDITELVFCWIGILIRCFIIAARYGYTSREKINLRKKISKLPIKYLSREYLIESWLFVKTETLDIEIKYSILRNQIETNLFYYNTLSLMENEWIKRLSTENFFEEYGITQEEMKEVNERMYKKYTEDVQYYKGTNINYIASNVFIKDLNENLKNSFVDLQYDKKAQKKNDNLETSSKTLFKIHSAKKTKEKEKFFDLKKYTAILPLLDMIREEKENKFNRRNFLKKKLSHLNLNSKQEFIKYDANYRGNNEEKNIRNKSSYLKLVKNLAKKLTSFKERSAIIFSKLDHESLPEEEDLPLYFHKPDLELVILKLPARILIRELFLVSQRFGNSKLRTIVFLLIIIKSGIPIYYRWIKKITIFGENPLENYLIIVNIFMTFFLFFFSMLFVEIGVADFERKIYVLESLSAMINPNKQNIEFPIKRYYPLINIFCPKNLKSWLNMRILAMDIGLRYFKRIELYASAFLFINGFISILLILGLYDLIHFLTIRDYPMFYIIGFSESFICFLIFYRLVYLGARINGFFKRHTNELNMIKFKLVEILNNYQKWTNMKCFVDPYLEKTKDYYYYCILYHNTRTMEEISNDKRNGVYFPNPLVEYEFEKYLEKLCDDYCKITEEIQLLEESSSMRILGFKITQEFLKQFYLALITIIFSLIQKYFDPNNSKS